MSCFGGFGNREETLVVVGDIGRRDNLIVSGLFGRKKHLMKN